jgi:hypothetical protein
MAEPVSVSGNRSIDSRNEIQVYADPGNQSLAIVLNEENLFTFQDGDFIRSGNGLAVRTLATATSRDLELMVR